MQNKNVKVLESRRNKLAKKTEPPYAILKKLDRQIKRLSKEG